MRRIPRRRSRVVIGNCQGGWAVMMLGASQPELTGALVLNGAPLSYWAGERGRNPMRYLGGLAGGSWPAALMADLGNGKFDGANLVLNFESLSPANTWFKKYYNLFQKADTEAERFLEFESWWGGYFLMNRDEIRWIVENLFIGDRFARGEISAGGGATFNMRAVRSPGRRLRLGRRQHHPARPGAALDRRRLPRRAGDQDARPDHRLPDA